MDDKELKFITAILDTRTINGEQRILKYYTTETDHRKAAKQAVKSLSNMGIVIYDLETYEGPPHRWNAQNGVTEK